MGFSATGRAACRKRRPDAVNNSPFATCCPTKNEKGLFAVRSLRKLQNSCVASFAFPWVQHSTQRLRTSWLPRKCKRIPLRTDFVRSALLTGDLLLAAAVAVAGLRRQWTYDRRMQMADLVVGYPLGLAVDFWRLSCSSLYLHGTFLAVQSRLPKELET